MLVILLLLYCLPIYLIFFKFRLLRLTTVWKVGLCVPPVAAGLFLWVALGRYTPFAQNAYIQAPVIQITPEVGGTVTEVFVRDNQYIEQGSPLFQIDRRPYQFKVDHAKAKLIETQENVLGLLASVYAADEGINRAEASLAIAEQGLVAAKDDTRAAQETAVEVSKQLEVAEKELARLSSLVGTGLLHARSTRLASATSPPSVPG